MKKKSKNSRQKKSIVLLSGGLDSSVNFYEALKATKVLLAITFDYGQRAATSEIRTARRLAEAQGVTHQVISLKWLSQLGKSSLTSRDVNVPTGHQIQMDSLKVSQKTAKSVWVPNRNGVFLNIAAAFAESLKADFIIPGFNLEEAATFPDNSQAFLKATTEAFRFSTSNQVQVKCFTTDLNKTQIVKRGAELGVPFEKIWPCYFSGRTWCGQCESCQRSIRALKILESK